MRQVATICSKEGVGCSLVTQTNTKSVDQLPKVKSKPRMGHGPAFSRGHLCSLELGTLVHPKALWLSRAHTGQAKVCDTPLRVTGYQGATDTKTSSVLRALQDHPAYRTPSFLGTGVLF